MSIRFIKYLFLLILVFSEGFTAPRSDSSWLSALTSLQPKHNCSHGTFSLDEDTLHYYDAYKIEAYLSVKLDGDDRGIRGHSITKLAANQFSLDRIDLMLSQTLIIDSVWADENHVTILDSMGQDSLQIFLTPALAFGDSISIGIAYHGLPPNIDSWGGFKIYQTSSWKPQIGYSMGDGLDLEPPPANYNWLPCFSDPNDKLLFESWFTAFTGKTVNANGLRIDTLQNNDSTTTWHYRIDQPISTYLIFVAVSDYVIQTQRAADPLIENFVYPSRTTQAQTHFSNVPAVLDGFRNLFGPYPFDRFGYTMTRQGDMEHATSVAHVDQLVIANHAYDWLLFHEMSHQWWGNWVTLGDWRDLWLNEGFATYCEALGNEIIGGQEAYMNYILMDLYPNGRAATDSYSIYDPDYYWGNTVYAKGACVLHMLRQVMGDLSFFAGLREYGQNHAFGNAVTADFQLVMEEHYGQSLDWFFLPWVYGTRYPRYRVTLVLDDYYPIIIEQIQATETLFRMPIDILVVNMENDSFNYRIWNDATRSQNYILGNDSLYPFWGGPQTIVLDPENKILKTVTYQQIVDADINPLVIPSIFRISSIYPNPFNASADISFELPKPSKVQLKVFDILGRTVSNEKLGNYDAGNHKISWNGSSQSSGVYFFQIKTEQESRLTKAVLLK